MVEHQSPNATSAEPVQIETGKAGGADRGRSLTPMIVWGVLSLAFAAYLAFGTVDARIWSTVTTVAGSRWEIRVESKSIATIWSIQAQTLPQVSYQWMMQSLFYGAILVFVVCVIAGMRYLVEQVTDERAPVVNEGS